MDWAIGEAQISRRAFLFSTALVGTLVWATGSLAWAAPAAARPDASAAPRPLALSINGQIVRAFAEPDVTLLDLLRERLDLTGTKKGCDVGACGACTVHVDGRPVLACLTLAHAIGRKPVLTIEGVADGEELHPLQAAFIEEDALQCGYCTPGQIMTGLACIKAGRTGSDQDVRSFMSGNLCRCGAYPNIVAAVRSAAGAA